MINASGRLSRLVGSRRHKNAAPHRLAITKLCVPPNVGACEMLVGLLHDCGDRGVIFRVLGTSGHPRVSSTHQEPGTKKERAAGVSPPTAPKWSLAGGAKPCVLC